MGRPIFILWMLAGCHHGVTATGSVVLEPAALNGASSPAQIDAVMASEAEILGAHQAKVKRRGGSLILDVEVADSDPQLAEKRCNELLVKYIDRRREMHAYEIHAKMELVSREMERTHDEGLREKWNQLEMERTILKNDAVLLEPCRATSATLGRAAQSAGR